MNSHLVVVGSLNADYVIRVPRFPVPGETLIGQDFQVFPGGKGANQAYAAARLGGRVSMLGQVGDDAQADWLRENLAAGGVDVSQILTDPSVSSGVANIMTDSSGQNQIVIVAGANGTFDRGRLESCLGLIQAAGLVLLQLEIPLETVQAAAQAAREAGALVLLDPAPAQPIPDELLALVDYLTPNETELAILVGSKPAPLARAGAAEWALKLLDRGARAVIVKMGAQGALLVRKGHEQFWPAIPVQALDTTAAGDAFNGALAVALSRGLAEADACQYATAAAACSVTVRGAQPSMPEPWQVEELLRRRV